MAKCRICGAAHKACGPATTVTPVDSNIIQGGQAVGLKRYEVVVPGRGGGHTTTLLLSDEDAKRAGVFKEKAAKAPANKSRAPQNKAAKPAAKKSAAKPAVEAASDPDASE